MVPPDRLPVAVVIPTRDRPQHLARVLAAVARAVDAVDEVVVVDSASTRADAVEAAVRAGVRVVRCEEPGASRARNAGAAATTAPIVAFTDDDCAPRPGWTQAIAAALADPARAFVTGRVVPDAVDGAVVSVLDDTTSRRLCWPDDPAGMGHGANAAFRRGWLEEVRGWDELMGAGAPLRGGEEQDLFLRIMHAGGEGRFEPAVEVIHHQWRGSSEALRLELAYGRGSAAVVRKAWSLDRRMGMRMLARRVWTDGPVLVLRDLLKGRRRAALHSSVRLAGTVAGLTRAFAYRVDGGLLRTRRSARHSGPGS